MQLRCGNLDHDVILGENGNSELTHERESVSELLGRIDDCMGRHHEYFLNTNLR